MNSIEKQLISLEEELLKFKSGQYTQGDSANYYSVEYMPGWFITNGDGYRDHTIECVPYTNTKKAIFTPLLCNDYYIVTGMSPVGRALIYPQEIITWRQLGESAAHLANEAYASGVPKGLIIFSNVKFFIKSSFIDYT